MTLKQHNYVQTNLLFTEFLGFGAGLEKWYLFPLSRRDIHENIIKSLGKKADHKALTADAHGSPRNAGTQHVTKRPFQAEPDIVLHQVRSLNAVPTLRSHKETRRDPQATLHGLPLQARLWYMNC